jgi:transcriptional regulator EpsA
MENEALPFGSIDSELILWNIHKAVEVRTRSEFFSWLQGSFQSVLAHEVLVCGIARRSTPGLNFDWVGSFPISEEHFSRLGRPDGGLLCSLVTMWLQGDRAPLLLGASPGPGSPPETEDVLNEIRELDLSNGVADGLIGLDGLPCSFFAFFKMPTPPCLRLAWALKMWLPYLYTGWMRAVGEETANAGRIRGVLTAREVVILSWVGKGKTNGHIARILGIGEATVATHLERIFRKLGVRSRAQAVAKGLTLNLQQGIGPGWRYYS